MCKCTVLTMHKRRATTLTHEQTCFRSLPQYIRNNDCCKVRARSAVCVRVLSGLILVKYVLRARDPSMRTLARLGVYAF